MKYFLVKRFRFDRKIAVIIARRPHVRLTSNQLWTHNITPTDRFLNKAPDSLYHCTKLAMRKFQKNRTNIKMSSIQKKKPQPQCTRYISAQVFSVYINFPPECWFVCVLIIQKKTKTSLLKTVKPWAKKLHCIRFEQENTVWSEETLKELRQTNRVFKKKKCLHCLPTKVCKTPQHLRQYSKQLF